MKRSAQHSRAPFRRSQKARGPSLLLFAQAGGSIPVPFDCSGFWLSAIFVNFTLFARANLVMMASLLVCHCRSPERSFWFWSWITLSQG
jgi:hypothetical protein